MKEIEVKAKVEDFGFLIEKLNELNCTLSQPLFQDDKIFLHKSLEFEDIKSGTPVLRIRNSNREVFLTLKKSIENQLVGLEKEITVSDEKQAEEILNHMEFREVVRVKKTRRKCRFKGLEICLDELEHLGNFVEVEKISNEDSLKVQEELFQFLESLGVKRENRVFQGYDTMTYFKLNSANQLSFLKK